MGLLGPVPRVARQAAERLAEAFERDQRVVVELNRAQDRLLKGSTIPTLRRRWSA